MGVKGEHIWVLVGRVLDMAEVWASSNGLSLSGFDGRYARSVHLWDNALYAAMVKGAGRGRMPPCGGGWGGRRRWQAAGTALGVKLVACGRAGGALLGQWAV